MNRKTLTLLSGLLIATIPATLIIFFFFNLNIHPNSASPIRLFNCFFVSTLFAVYALRKGSVDLTGAITGYVCAMIFIYSNYGFLFSLLGVYFVSSRATKYQGSVKNQFEENYHKDSCRNWVQIVCNLGVAAQLTVFYLIEAGPAAELPLDFQKSFNASCLIAAILGAFSCSLGDTLASELGTVLAKSDPILVTTLRRVPRGTNGGVSLPGLVVSGLGGLIVGCCYLTSLYLFVDREKVLIIHAQWPILLITFLDGLYGSLLDSFLGAIFQFSGLNNKTGRIVSQPGPSVHRISGYNLLDNHTVNLLSTLITPVFSIFISVHIYHHLT